jgi:hypothetical protein
MSAELNRRKARLFDGLQAAITLELSTLPAYLTALWSMPPGTNAPAAAIVRSVLMEEMLHLTLAANVLSALGGRVRLAGSALPVYPLTLEFDHRGGGGQRRVDVHLERFSEHAIHAFMQIELPAHVATPRRHAMAPELVIPDDTIGQFYDDLVADMRALCDEFGEAAVFSGDPAHQVSLEFYWKGGGHPVVVEGIDSAARALRVITTQGEGADGRLFDGDRHFAGQPDEIAHYYRFNQIVARRYYAPTDSIHRAPSGEPLPVDDASVLPIRVDAKQADYAGHPALAALNARFNAAYSMMLWQLMEGFNGHPPVFYTAIRNGMADMAELGRALMAMPMPGDAHGCHAAPSFEWNGAAAGLPASMPE